MANFYKFAILLTSHCQSIIFFIAALSSVGDMPRLLSSNFFRLLDSLIRSGRPQNLNNPIKIVTQSIANNELVSLAPNIIFHPLLIKNGF